MISTNPQVSLTGSDRYKLKEAARCARPSVQTETAKGKYAEFAAVRIAICGAFPQVRQNYEEMMRHPDEAPPFLAMVLHLLSTDSEAPRSTAVAPWAHLGRWKRVAHSNQAWRSISGRLAQTANWRLSGELTTAVGRIWEGRDVP